MSARASGVGGAFHNLADVLETFETDDTDATVTNAVPVSDDVIEEGGVAVDVTALVPLLDGAYDTQATTVHLVPDGVRLQEDGSLRVKLRVTAGRATDSEVTTREGERREHAESDAESENDRPSASGETTRGAADGIVVEPNAATETNTSVTETDTSDEEPRDDEGAESESRQNDTPTESAESEEEEPDPARDGDDDRPAFRDPDRLREAYENHDTFTEMTDALGVDVTPQTVRRYMIKYDIHEPSPNTCSDSINTLLEADPDSFPITTDERDRGGDGDRRSEEGKPDWDEPDSSGPSPANAASDGGSKVGGPTGRSPESERDEAADEESDRSEGGVTKAPPDGTSTQTDGGIPDEVVESAGIELPSDLDLDEVTEAVRDAKTLYEVHQQLGTSLDRTRELLRELNLFDLVRTRLSTDEYRERTLEEINERIYAVASSESA